MIGISGQERQRHAEKKDFCNEVRQDCRKALSY